MDINDKLNKINPREFKDLTGFDQSEETRTEIVQGLVKALKRANELKIKQREEVDFQKKLDDFKNMIEDY